MLKPNQLKEARNNVSVAIAFICLVFSISLSPASFADSNLPQISHSYKSASAGMGIRLTITPATNPRELASGTPYDSVKSALESNELSTMEIDSGSLLSDFSLETKANSTETASEMVDRLERAVEQLQADSSVDSDLLVLIVSAG